MLTKIAAVVIAVTSISVSSLCGASQTQIYCSLAEQGGQRDPRVAMWNACRDRENAAGTEVRACAGRALAPLARVGKIERISDSPTGMLDTSGDRVAVADPDGAVWVITDRAKTKLSAPKPKADEFYSIWQYWPRFAQRDGSLMLLGSGSTASSCGGTEGVWRWRYRAGWVLESDPSRTTPSEAFSLEPKGAFPELPGSDEEVALAGKRRDAMGRPWIAGAQGAFVYDHNKWWQVLDAPSKIESIAVQGNDRVWLSGKYGLYRIVLAPTITPFESPGCAPIVELPKLSGASEGVKLEEAPLANVKVERVSFPVQGGEPMTSASAVITGPQGAMYFVENGRIVVVEKGGARRYGEVAAGVASQPIAFENGNVWHLSRNSIVRSSSANAPAPSVVVYEPSAIAMKEGGGWGVSCMLSAASPSAMRWNGKGWAEAYSIPQACYQSIALTKPDDAWLVGGLRAHQRAPSGKGIMVHVQGDSVQAFEIPEGALLSVAALNSGDVYAGGYDGLLVHWRGSVKRAFRVSSDPWILGLTADRDRVAIVGEDLVGVLRGDKLFRVPARLVPRGTFRSAAFDSSGALWVVGDAALLRITFRLP